MSTIFTETTVKVPRHDATICVAFYKMPPEFDVSNSGEYRTVHLLEFHPDFDPRMKMRGRAYIKRADWMEHPAYEVAGAGFLETPYVEIREFMIHQADRAEMYRWSRTHQYATIIIEKQPIPFPLFAKGDRVVCICEDERWPKRVLIGQIGTITERSSGGGMSSVRWDKEECNKGSDGVIYKSLGISSSCLRLYVPDSEENKE
jgi:hypothetical protein